MSGQLITNILDIEAEADTIVNNAKQKAEKIISDIDNEINLYKGTLENENHLKIKQLRVKMSSLQRAEEEVLKNKFESLKEKLLHIDSKSTDDAVNWVLKHIYER